MADKVIDKIFNSLQSIDSDALFVENPPMPNYRYIENAKSEESFKDFMNRPSMKKFSTEEKNQIRNLWIQGGQPFINIQKKGDPNLDFYGKQGRASYSDPFDPGKYKEYGALNIFEDQLLDGFMAEIAHGFQFARKPNEDYADWEMRIYEKNQKISSDHDFFGDRFKYGHTLEEDKSTIFREHHNVGVSGKETKVFPYKHIEKYDRVSISDEQSPGGYKEIWQDDKGNYYRDLDSLKDADSYRIGIPKIKWDEFDPKTRRGLLTGKKPTQEFEAHSIIEDSLWNDWNERFIKLQQIQEDK